MTRLTEDDVRGLTARLLAFEADLVAACGLTLHDLAQRTVDIDRALAGDPRATDAVVSFDEVPVTARVPLEGASVAAVPVHTGEGVIPGFCECVVTILKHLGCQAAVTSVGDVRGLQEAADGGAEVVFIADDFRFIALNLGGGACIDDDPATADGYATALAAAAGGLAGRPVVLVGLGPVGRAAGRRMTALGAELLAVENDPAAVRRAVDLGLEFTHVDMREGLSRADLVYDATPAADLISRDELRSGAVVAAPGIPPAADAGARRVLGVRHIHEPLAIGVAVMAARALA